MITNVSHKTGWMTFFFFFLRYTGAQMMVFLDKFPFICAFERLKLQVKYASRLSKTMSLWMSIRWLSASWYGLLNSIGLPISPFCVRWRAYSVRWSRRKKLFLTFWNIVFGARTSPLANWWRQPVYRCSINFRSLTWPSLLRSSPRRMKPLQ